MTDPRHICAVIPTFNNGGTVADVVRGVLRQGLPVLVVDDGSTDDTQEKLKDLDIRILRHETNRGKGRALKTGLEAARKLGYRFALTLDADGQHDPADIPALVAAAGERTLVIGSRNLTAEGMPSGNTFANKFSNFWFTVQTGRKLPDTQTGFRIYPLEDLPSLKLPRSSSFPPGRTSGSSRSRCGCTIPRTACPISGPLPISSGSAC